MRNLVYLPQKSADICFQILRFKVLNLDPFNLLNIDDSKICHIIHLRINTNAYSYYKVYNNIILQLRRTSNAFVGLPSYDDMSQSRVHLHVSIFDKIYVRTSSVTFGIGVLWRIFGSCNNFMSANFTIKFNVGQN